MVADISPDVVAEKKRAIRLFHDHVSPGKVEFFGRYGMDVVMGRREGPWFWDLTGDKRLFNLHGNGGVYNLGHRHPALVEVIQRGLEELDIGNGHLISRARAELAQALTQTMPGDLDYVVFGVSGGEAVDLALKVARAFTGRPKIISALGGYHGHTGLAMAAGDEKYRAPFGPQPPGFVQVPFADPDSLEEAIDGETAALILETVPATLGMVVPPPDYLPLAADLCRRRGALLILDEVQTGWARTGRLWGFEHFGVTPDVVVLGKGMSGGLYPITATVIRRPLEAVFRDDPFIHVSTFGGAELGCLVALEVLAMSSAPDFLARVNRLAARFKAGIDDLARRHALLRGLRQLGLFMGLELDHDMGGPLLSLAGYHQELFLVYANNDPRVCQFLPPLIITDEEADWVLERLDRSLAAAARLKEAFPGG